MPVEKLNPFEEPQLPVTVKSAVRSKDKFYVDMSEVTAPEGVPIRVELRKTKPSFNKDIPAVGDEYMLGLLDQESFPEVGKPFLMRHYKINNWLDYGKTTSVDPVTEVKKVDDCFYFTTSDGDWRLKIMDVGN